MTEYTPPYTKRNRAESAKVPGLNVSLKNIAKDLNWLAVFQADHNNKVQAGINGLFGWIVVRDCILFILLLLFLWRTW